MGPKQDARMPASIEISVKLVVCLYGVLGVLGARVGHEDTMADREIL